MTQLSLEGVFKMEREEIFDACVKHTNEEIFNKQKDNPWNGLVNNQLHMLMTKGDNYKKGDFAESFVKNMRNGEKRTCTHHDYVDPEHGRCEVKFCKVDKDGQMWANQIKFVVESKDKEKNGLMKGWDTLVILAVSTSEIKTYYAPKNQALEDFLGVNNGSDFKGTTVELENSGIFKKMMEDFNY